MRGHEAALLLTLGLVGCGSHPPPPTEPRLRQAEGDSGLLFDSELGISCWMTSWTATDARCLPPMPLTVPGLPSGAKVYVDSQCSVLAVPSVDPSATISAYPPDWLDCEPPPFYRLGEVPAGPFYYKGAYDYEPCLPFTPPPASGVTYHLAGPAVEPDSFAYATLFHREEGRLNEAFWQTGDGALVTTRNTVFHNERGRSSIGQSLYFDSERSELCIPRNACDGKVRCMPFSHMIRVASSQGILMADEHCQHGLASEGGHRCFYRNTSAFPQYGVDCASYARLGAKVQVSLGMLVGTVCVRSIGGGIGEMSVIEEHLPDDTFAELP